jgi:hypothetical protein
MVTYRGFLDMQVCVPASWNDREVLNYAEEVNESGTNNGWFVRKAGDKALNGDPERQPCAEREGYVHIVLDV